MYNFIDTFTKVVVALSPRYLRQPRLSEEPNTWHPLHNVWKHTIWYIHIFHHIVYSFHIYNYRHIHTRSITCADLILLWSRHCFPRAHTHPTPRHTSNLHHTHPHSHPYPHPHPQPHPDHSHSHSHSNTHSPTHLRPHYWHYTDLQVMNLQGTGWRRLIESVKLHIIFHKRVTNYRALLRKMTYKDKGSYESSPPVWLDAHQSNRASTSCVHIYTNIYTHTCTHFTPHTPTWERSVESLWSVSCSSSISPSVNFVCAYAYVHTYIYIHILPRIPRHTHRFGNARQKVYEALLAAHQSHRLSTWCLPSGAPDSPSGCATSASDPSLCLCLYPCLYLCLCLCRGHGPHVRVGLCLYLCLYLDLESGRAPPLVNIRKRQLYVYFTWYIWEWADFWEFLLRWHGGF